MGTIDLEYATQHVSRTTQHVEHHLTALTKHFSVARKKGRVSAPVRVR